jgi:methylated-DNA-[protein]-cysteine S-methyltransferase
VSPVAFALFDTAIGRCAIAWREDVVTAVSLPEDTPERTVIRMSRRFPGAQRGEPPAIIRAAIDDMVKLLEGEERDLRDVVLDMRGISPFNASVYEIARAIPPGETMSYGEIAAKIGMPDAARAVGKALGENPFPIVVPCHRVIAAKGKIGGFSANGGAATKLRMLAIERGELTIPGV